MASASSMSAVSAIAKRKKRLIGAMTAPMIAGAVLLPTSTAGAAGEPAAVWTYPVSESVMMAVEAAREKAHQALMDLPAWNATIFGPFPAAAITTQAGDITFVHINLPSMYKNKSASVRMGSLSGTTWVNTSLGSVKLNMYGNGTYKTSVQMPSGTRAQVYVGGKLVTTTIRP